MHLSQPGILAEETQLARFIEFRIASESDIPIALKILNESIDVSTTVIGLGASVAKALNADMPGLRSFQSTSGSGINIPATNGDLWCWLRGSDQGELFHRSREIISLLAPGFAPETIVDSFQHDQNRDLSGYEDGTENPTGPEAIEAAIVQNQRENLDGSSFVAVQKWVHDFDALNAMTTPQRDDVIGRHISDNEEFDDAPESAHVKRTAQESFNPEAFMLRRSMPWTDGENGGLLFVSFGKSFDAFEAQLNRMLGKEDSVCDALFSFTQPVTGAYYWCPPIKNGRLNLRLLQIE